MILNKILLITAGAFLGLALVFPGPLAAEPIEITARVDKVDVSNPKKVGLGLVPFSDKGCKDKKKPFIDLTVTFTPEKGEAIDWSNPDNRKKAVVLGLEQDDVIQVRIDKNKDQLVVRELKMAGTRPLEVFPGDDKIVDRSLLDDFYSTPAKVGVILTLGKVETVPKPKEFSRGEIKKMQDKVLASLGPDEFTLRERFENVPMLSGLVTLNGLKTIAGDPLVLTIEKDQPMQIMQP